jgi:tetrahydromethanopterin S-methyltransferase subunit G
MNDEDYEFIKTLQTIGCILTWSIGILIVAVIGLVILWVKSL